MKNNFQTIVLIIFAFGAVLGVVAFALYRAKGQGADIPQLQMWGVMPAENLSFLNSMSGNDYFKKITYREIDPESFDQVFANALADGMGPDIVLLRDDLLLKQKNRLYEILYESYSAADFYNTYIDAAEIFESSNGYYALPAAIDPLVMYWNRDILTSAGIAAPPTYWDEMRDFGDRITKTDGFLEIELSALALGTYGNINNAKDIISLLLMQSGSRIVARNGAKYTADFSQTSEKLTLPPSEALNFYTEFANPNKTSYTWNTSLPMSRNAFLSEDLALYFGRASEEAELTKANPNLSFGVSFIPQVRAGDRKMTTGDIYGFAVVKNTRNFTHAFNAVFNLAGAGISELDQRTALPSVRRSLLKENPKQAASRVFVESALVARFWHDPDSARTNSAFARMIESISSNAQSSTEAINRLRQELQQILGN